MLQIQPEFAHRERWAALAEREGVGYEPIELSLPRISREPEVFQAYFDWYRASGRVTSLHGAFMDVNPASGDPDFRLLSQKKCHESCRIAAALGAKRVVFHASALPFLRGAYLDSWAAICGEFYMELAQTYGLTLYVENSQDLDPEPLRAVMARVQGSGVQVCLDVGHAHYSGTPVDAWFEALEPWIGYLHLSDNGGRFDDHLPLGEGSVDWAGASAGWERLKREIPITLEVGGIEGAERSLAYLRRNRLFGMEER